MEFFSGGMGRKITALINLYVDLNLSLGMQSGRSNIPPTFYPLYPKPTIIQYLYSNVIISLKRSEPLFFVGVTQIEKHLTNLNFRKKKFSLYSNFNLVINKLFAYE